MSERNRKERKKREQSKRTPKYISQFVFSKLKTHRESEMVQTHAWDTHKDDFIHQKLFFNKVSTKVLLAECVHYWAIKFKKRVWELLARGDTYLLSLAFSLPLCPSISFCPSFCPFLLFFDTIASVIHIFQSKKKQQQERRTERHNWRHNRETKTNFLWIFLTDI